MRSKFLYFNTKLNNMKKVNDSYQTPLLEVLNIATEAGFTISNGIGLPGETPDFNDYGDF